MAKKKYYQNKKDRKDESRGMKKYEETMSKKPYERENKFSFGNDYSAPYNMPPAPKMAQYPKVGYDMDGYYPDTLAGIDFQIDSDGKTINKQKNEGYKY